MPIRWGIVTAGKIAHDFTSAFNSYPGQKDGVIAAVAAWDRQKAEEFAKLHGIPKVFNSYEDMAKSDDIDIAYIASLNPQHYEHAKLFLMSGKHVLCEKPLCMNLKQVRSLINIAKENKLFLMEAIWSRFSAPYLALEKEIKDGKLGDVQFVEVNFGLPIADVDRLKKKELGGSVLLDLGIYNLQFAQYIFKEEPIHIHALGELNAHGTDAACTAVLQYPGGKSAVLNITSKLRLWNKATVYGTKGRITVQDPFHFPTELIHVDGKVEKFSLHESPIPYNFENGSGLVFEALEAMRCIQQGLFESPRVPHKESLLLATLEDTIRKQLGVHFDVDDQEFDSCL
ncbi:unnamed protein product [Colias eurytheme]|nr:unnamed protein product [Colias eurytheme]